MPYHRPRQFRMNTAISVVVRTLTLAIVCTNDFSSGCSASAPNLLLILADDMGYGDLGCQGSRMLRTPHLDRLADDGVRCSQAYVVSSVCSPSRAGLMTGRDPRRFGYEGNLNQSAGAYATRPDLLGLPPGESTLADHLRPGGYATGLVGKWHLGTGEGFHPNDRGFDHFCGMLGGSHSYWPLQGPNRIERNGVAVTEFSSEYLTDFFTDEGIRFIEDQNNKDAQRPWLLFMSYNAPHTPMHAKEDDLSRFTHISDAKRRTYAAMVHALDRGVGRLRETLRQCNELENTLIVFFSDNGGATNNGSWNGPLRGVKGTLREGGVRVPMIWAWPNRLPSSQTSEQPMSSLDVLPTFLAAADAEPLPLAKPRSYEDVRNRRRMVNFSGAYDGLNLLPLLTGKAVGVERRFFWRLQGQAAVLDGRDKLIRLSHRPAEMFRPAEDPGESVNLRSDSAERFEQLFDLLGQWESMLATVPLWGSSPYWVGESAEQYDGWAPRKEPETSQVAAP